MAADGDIATLIFTPDNPCNTMITSSTGETAYSVLTEVSRKATFTQVRDAQDEVIGSLEWRDMLSDRVTLRNGRCVSFSDWVKKSIVPFKE